MKTVILAGGLGTRIREESEFRPKPMVLIGNRPILWHIMKTYSHFDFNEFIVCVGYRGDDIRNYFLNYKTSTLDFTINLSDNQKIVHNDNLKEKWNVTVAETGPSTPTGGRIFKIRDHITEDLFMCTYGDGVSNINIQKLLEFHRAHDKIATLSAVKVKSRFGVLDISNSANVQSFQEKPMDSGWINAGYFVFNRKVFEYLDENSVLESSLLKTLSNQNELMAYKHEDFWQPMDTYRESQILNNLWSEDRAPWKLWD